MSNPNRLLSLFLLCYGETYVQEAIRRPSVDIGIMWCQSTMLAEFPFPPRCCRYIMQSGSLCSLFPPSLPFRSFKSPPPSDDGDALKIDDHHARLWPTDVRARPLARQLRVMALVKEAAMTAAKATERPFLPSSVEAGWMAAGTRCDTFRDVLKLIRRDERTLRGWNLGAGKPSLASGS